MSSLRLSNESTREAALPQPTSDPPPPASHGRPLLPVSLPHDEQPLDEKEDRPLPAFEQARALVRLIQCELCSRPYKNPVTLPCGRSACRTCLPESYERGTITWPDLPDRRRAIKCPFDICGTEHIVADSCLDVVLYRTMEAIAELVDKQTSLSSYLDSQGDHIESITMNSQGIMIALYLLAAASQLPYDDDGTSLLPPSESEKDRNADQEVVAALADLCQKELDCQVCYSLMLDPVTTACGHTLCRRCLVRSLDHSSYCPVCRRKLLMAPSLHTHPSNKTLGKLLDGLCAESIAARKEAFLSEERSLMGDFDIPLFIVTLGFPGCPTFLRVFEPRYRLMLRRALDGNGTFGLVMYNTTGEAQGELGRSQFMQYGTLLRIENAQMMPDGTSIIEARGVSRFKVMSSGILDGYAVGRVERVEDIPLVEEEALEAEQLAVPPAGEDEIDAELSRMTTHDLLTLGLDFVRHMQTRSAVWLHENVLSAYGGPPDDAALFPFWFASILPTDDSAKYQLLQTTSVRQRLKITARWVKAMQAQRWYAPNPC